MLDIVCSETAKKKTAECVETFYSERFHLANNNICIFFVGQTHLCLNVWLQKYPLRAFFFAVPLLRSTYVMCWLLYWSNVNLLPLALGFVCIAMHQTHLGQWTKGKKMAWFSCLPFLLSNQEEGITCQVFFLVWWWIFQMFLFHLDLCLVLCESCLVCFLSDGLWTLSWGIDSQHLMPHESMPTDRSGIFSFFETFIRKCTDQMYTIGHLPQS